jgi:AmmeMemoRadiSam system protein A
MFTLSANERKILLNLARETIAASFDSREPGAKPLASIPDGWDSLRVPCGAFVTLHSHGRLRGCIGNIVGTRPLAETVAAMARSSAFEDPRFPPLKRIELDSIDIEISVLSPLETVDSPDRVIPGTHGVYITKGFRSGLLLPQVATEQGWDRETFLTHTCYKAGLDGDAWKRPDTEIQVFTAIVFGEKIP